MYLKDAEDSFIQDSYVNSTNSNDVVVVSGGDHVMLNVSYTDESVSGGSITRGWYLDIKVNDTGGNEIYEANVSGGDVFGSLDFSELTDINGRISRQQLAEYLNDGGIKTDYNNYWVNATKSGYPTGNATVNFTETRNTFLVITLGNTLPSISNIIINSSSGKNLTTENISVYVAATDADGDNIKKIYNWYKNNKSLAFLYLAFEGESNFSFTKDYSNNGNDGEVINAIWDSTGGYDGFGAYVFNDQDERIIVNDSNSIDMNGNFTLLARVYPKTETYAIAIKGTLDEEYDYRFYSWSGFLRFRWGNGSESGSASCNGCTDNEIDKWLLLGVVYTCNNTGSSVDFYINGEYNSTDTSNTTCVEGGTSDLWIGSRSNLAYTLNGTIDEFRIYNYTLSANQIRAIYNNQTNVIVSEETNVGDLYKCEVVPYDGKADGESMNSTELLVTLPNDTSKFFLRNDAGGNVAWLGDEGNIVLKGQCFAQTTCITNDNDSFIIGNSTDSTTAYINSTGDLCIEKGDCSDLSASCNPIRDAFIIRNATSGMNMSYIDYDGELCLTGRLYENSNP